MCLGGRKKSGLAVFPCTNIFFPKRKVKDVNAILRP